MANPVTALPLVSIVIDNYNYAHFLRDAIDSALGQTYAPVEVIVVDDGSSDGSAEIIESYGSALIALFKANGGQASTFNVGLARSRGEILIFLDADDVLERDAVATIVPLFDDAEVIKANWPLEIVDRDRKRSGQLFPTSQPPRGDFRQAVLRTGPDNYPWPPTSGNAWSRGFLERIFPISEDIYRSGAETYPVGLAPFLGKIEGVDRPLAQYRLHGGNDSQGMAFWAKLERELRWFDHYTSVAATLLAEDGIAVDPSVWRATSWHYRVKAFAQDMEALVPADEFFILIDDELTGIDASFTRRARPLVSIDGEYGGPPADDDVAIRELEFLRAAGAHCIAFAWPSFWWLEHYSGLRGHLESRYPCVLRNERSLVFLLAGRDAATGPGAG